MHRTSRVRTLWCAATLLCLAIGSTSAFGLQRPVHVEPAGEHELLVANPKASSGSCGVERWSVKVGTDPDASLVNLNSTTSQTIAYLRGLTAPASPPLNSRVQPTEITDFVLNATLVEYKLENDSDYHLVIKDAAGNTMIAEIPDPACVGSGSPFASRISAARAAFDAKYNVTTSFQTANIPVQLTGVAFFDFLHGQTGVAPNGIELHPLLNVNFNPGTPTPDFSLSPSPSSVTVVQGASATSTITIVPVNGFNSSVTFAAAGLPAGVTASFSPASSTGSTTLTLTASASATTGAATISIAGSTGSLTHTTSVNLTVNPSGSGTPDFGLSASPSSVTATQGGSASSTITVAPLNGFTGSVTFAAAGLPTGVTASFSPTSSTGSTTLTLTASASAATGSATVSVAGANGSLTHTTSVNLTVNPAGGGTTAVYNSTLKAPACAAVGVSCDSGTLLVGRGTITGGTEPNHPNTINATCPDGNSGTFHSDESNDRIVIASTDGGPLTAGHVVRVTDTVWVYDTTDALDLYSAPNANSPVWTFLNTIGPSGTGAQTLTTTFTLPAGGLQAIRAHFRSGGSASSCSTGAYDESDDLIFAVSSTAPAPEFSLSASPTSVSMNQGASAASIISVGSINGYNSGTSLSVSGLPTGLTASLSPVAVTPASGGSATSTLTVTASSSAAAGTYNVTVNGVSGSLSHSVVVPATVTVPSGSSQLLGNTGFETGSATPWTMSTGTLCSNSTCTGEVAHGGTWFDWMNGYGSAHTDTLSQTVAIPAGKTSATLQFYMHIDTAETGTSAYDTLKVQVYNTAGTLLGTLNTYSNLNANTGYSVHSLSMTPYIGQTVVIKFTGTEDASLQTSFVIDDVTLNVQ